MGVYRISYNGFKYASGTQPTIECKWGATNYKCSIIRQDVMSIEQWIH